VKAARLHNYNEYLQVDEVDEPEITGPLDVIVKIGAAGLCRTDIHIKDGDWREIQEEEGVELPYTLGHENAGWVAEIGPEVTNVEVGDAVVVHPLITCGLCRPCRAGNDMHCVMGVFPGLVADGGFADLLKTHARSVIKLDPGLEPALDVASNTGADHTVLADGTEVDAVTELTDGLGAEAVLDFVAEQGVEKEAPKMVKGAGTYYVVGYGGALDVLTHSMIFREINIVGNLVGTYNELSELMTLAAQGKVTLHTSTYPLDAVNDAMADLENGNLQGRGILVPEGAAA
jgi:NAD+-dependent secondary alcohol dehydrogenase Adh1